MWRCTKWHFLEDKFKSWMALARHALTFSPSVPINLSGARLFCRHGRIKLLNNEWWLCLSHRMKSCGRGLQRLLFPRASFTIRRAVLFLKCEQSLKKVTLVFLTTSRYLGLHSCRDIQELGKILLVSEQPWLNYNYFKLQKLQLCQLGYLHQSY